MSNDLPPAVWPKSVSERPVEGDLIPGLPNNVQYRMAVDIFKRLECLMDCEGSLITDGIREVTVIDFSGYTGITVEDPNPSNPGAGFFVAGESYLLAVYFGGHNSGDWTSIGITDLGQYYNVATFPGDILGEGYDDDITIAQKTADALNQVNPYSGIVEVSAVAEGAVLTITAITPGARQGANNLPGPYSLHLQFGITHGEDPKANSLQDTAILTNAPTPTLVRSADILAVATIASNTGDVPVEIYEDDVLVLILAPQQSEQLPLTGSLKITGRCSSPGSVTVVIQTIHRCLCGDDPYLNGDEIPIGHDLI